MTKKACRAGGAYVCHGEYGDKYSRYCTKCGRPIKYVDFRWVHIFEKASKNER
jgi:hypothetical protein